MSDDNEKLDKLVREISFEGHEIVSKENFLDIVNQINRVREKENKKLLSPGISPGELDHVSMMSLLMVSVIHLRKEIDSLKSKIQKYC